MKTILDQISAILSDSFVTCGYDADLGKVTISNRPDLCEFQCNGAMAGAKRYKKAPIMIANEVVKSLENREEFSMIEAVMPGFINIKVSKDFLVAYTVDMAKDEKYGCEPVSPKKVFIDYGGANAAKPLHVGHLRSAVIGESYKRINRYMGNTVWGDVHLGDWGLQMGLVIEELRDRKPDLCYFDPNFKGPYPKESPFTMAELEEIYPTASKKSKEKVKDADGNDTKELTKEAEAFAKRAHDSTVKLQQQDPACVAIWNHIMALSKVDLKKNYDNLNVSFDIWKGESDAKPYIDDMIDDFINKGLAYESQGALVVDVREETDTKEVPPCIVRKSDGAALYATSDLATLIERQKEYAPDEYIYITDKRQEMHFLQVFRVAKKAGIVPDTADLRYVGFGTMNGKDGKPFKTRDGGVMRLENLVKQIEDAVYEKTKENTTLSEEEIANNAKIIGLAAIKYGDLSNQATKDYIFDIDRFTSFEGDTGPYILYTIVRIKSILQKYYDQKNETPKKACELTSSFYTTDRASERDLYLMLTRFNEFITGAYEDLAPHKICSYIFELSNRFNKFYHDTKILGEEDEKTKEGLIALITITKEILETCIDLLGFSAPDRM